MIILSCSIENIRFAVGNQVFFVEKLDFACTVQKNPNEIVENIELYQNTQNT